MVIKQRMKKQCKFLLNRNVFEEKILSRQDSTISILDLVLKN